VLEPAFELPESADLAHVDRGLDVLEQPVADEPPLGGQDVVHVGRVEPVVVPDALGHDLLRLPAGQPAEVADDHVQVFSAELHGHRPLGRQLPHRPAHDLLQLRHVRERDVELGGDRRDDRRQLARVVDEQQVPARVGPADAGRHVPARRRHGRGDRVDRLPGGPERPLVGQVLGQVEQHVQRRPVAGPGPDAVRQHAQRGRRVVGVRQRRGSRPARPASR
jgi:hypothetical protein